MATSVGDIYLKLGLDKKPFLRGMSEVENTAGGLAGAIGKKIAGGLALAGLTKFASDCIYAGSKLNAMRSMASVAFPSMTKEVEAFAKNASSSFGLSEKMALQYTATLGSMARGMGFSEQQALSLSSTIAGLSGDVASFYSMSQDEAFSKLQAIFTGETESLKSLGVVMTQNALDQYALANGFGMTTNAMSEQEKVVLRYQFVLSQLQLAQGDFMRTQSAWGNQVKILRMRFAELQAQLGQGLINVLKPAIYALNVFMGKLIQVASVFNAFIARITGAGKKKKGGLKGFASSLYDVGKASKGASGGLGNIGGGAGKVAKGAKKASKALKQLQRDVLGFDRINKLSKKDNSSVGGVGGGGGAGGGGGLGDIGGYEGDIDGLNGKLFDLAGVSKKLGPILRPIADIFKALFRLAKALVKAFAPVGKFIWNNLIKPFGKLIGMAIIAVLEGIAGAIELLAMFVEKHPKITVVLAGIGTALAVISKGAPVIGIIGKLAGVFKMLGLALMAHPIIAIITGIALAIGYIYKHWDKIKKTKFGKVLIKVGNTLKKIGSYIAGTFLKKFEQAKKLVQGFKDAWTGIKSKAIELKAKIGEVAGEAWEGITDTVATITVGLQDNFSDAWNKIKDVWNGIKSRAESIATSLADKFKSAWDGIKGAWDGIKSRTESVTTKLVDYFSNAWNGIKSKWNDVKSHTATLTVNIKANLVKGWNGLVKKLRGAKLKVIKKFGNSLPYLAEGGWVDKNTPQLAVVGDNKHEGEIVAPDSKLMAMARQAAQEASGAGNAQVINLLAQILSTVAGMNTNVYLDGKEIASNTVKRINQQTRTTGQFPLIV